MRIQHNIMAMSAYRNYTNNVAAMKKNLEKLSSGYKINRAGDDAAGLAISEKMRAQITGLETAQKNAKDGISLVQTAEGALTEVHDMLNRMVELATQSANGTYDNETDRDQLQKEMNQLREEINRIADSSNFNGIKLLDGSMSTDVAGVITAGAAASAVGAGYKDMTNDVVAWGSFTASGTVAPTASMGHLKAEGKPAAVGSFVVDLNALKVEANGTATTAIKITIGGASATIKAADSNTALTASGIATELGKLNFVVSTDGTTKLATSTTTLAAGDLVYSASADGNRVTFTLSAAMASATVAGNGDAIASAGDIPDTITEAQQGSLNFTVGASMVAGKSMQGWQQVGVTEYTNTSKAGAQQFGQAVVEFNASKITDGMKITIGTGSSAKTMTIRTQGTLSASETASNTIDLTKIVNASTGTGKKDEIAQAIANAFQKTNQGIEVGVDSNSNLVISEQVTASGVSAAATAVQNAMKTPEGFKSLVKIEGIDPDSAVAGSKTFDVNTKKIYAGNVLEIADGTGSSANVVKFEFTTDTTKTGTNPKTGAQYVAMGSNVAANLKSAIEDAFGSDAVAVASVAVGTNGKVTVKFTDGTGNASDMNISLTNRKGLRLQIGDTAEDFNQLNVEIKDCHTDALGIADISIADQESAAKAVDAIKSAINYVSDVRGTLGATQNRLDHTINNLSVMTENIQDAESTIRDTDVAEEMMAYTKNNILIQSAQAMLAQANQVPQGVLQLLQ